MKLHSELTHFSRDRRKSGTPFTNHLTAICVALLLTTLFVSTSFAQVNPPSACAQTANAPYNLSKLIGHLHNPVVYNNVPQVVLATHRGAWKDYPDNSVEAFNAANQRGDEAIEADIRLSKDGTPWIMHDDVLNRQTSYVPSSPTAPDNYIVNQTDAVLSTLYMRDRHGAITLQKLSKLDDFLAWYYNGNSNFRQPGVCTKSTGYFGTLVVFDVKSTSTVQYQAFLTIIKYMATHKLFINSTGNLGELPLIWKMPFKIVPTEYTQFVRDTATAGHSVSGHSLILTINPEDGAPDPSNTEWPKFLNYDIPGTGDAASFEVNYSSPYSPVRAWITFFNAEGISVQTYLEKNYYPEGIATGGTCCRYNNTLLEIPNPPLSFLARPEDALYLANVVTLDDPTELESALTFNGSYNPEIFTQP